MKKYFYQLAIGVMTAALLNACTTQEKASKPPVRAEDTVSFVNVEPVSGKLNVYSSMARAVKYNVDVTTKNIHKKVFEETKGKSPEQIMQVLTVGNPGGENPLYGAARKLDFAVIYAASHLSDNQTYLKNNLYAKSAQQLALVAIKMHKDVLFADRKTREIERQITAQEKIVKSLNAKLSRNGVLNNEDLEYKKGLEVGILKLKQLHSYLQASVAEYSSVVKSDAKRLQVEGRHFYELEDFDKNNQIETFQSVALDNRSEFNIARDEVFGFNPQNAKKNAVRQYPETEMLSLNGYDIKDPLYIDNLQKRAEEIAINLLKAVNAYLMAQKPEEKGPLKAEAFDQLGVAVMVQIELDYDMVRMADMDYSGAGAKVKELRKEVREMERRYNLKPAEKVELLNKSIILSGQELLESQVSAERAMALRALYFHAGLSPFNQTLIQAQIPGIEENLKASFNKDMIEMLARAEVKQKVTNDKGNVWAKENNWLEVLVDDGGPKEPQPIDIPVKPQGDFDPYIGEQYNKMKVMQLGSYRQRQNVDVEWKVLQDLYPEFGEVKPKVESGALNGKTIYRLILKSDEGGFLEICNKLRADRIECILR